jgi:hypothetical protein
MVADGGSLREFRQANHLKALAPFRFFSTVASAARTAGLGANRRPVGASEALLMTPELPPIRQTSPETIPKPLGKCKNHTEYRHKSR